MASSRTSQRAGTAGAPSRRRGAESTIVGAAKAAERKSCAACPIASSGRGEPEGGAHRAAEPGAGIGRRRPDALDEPAEHDDLGRLQAGLEQAPDEDPRMLGPGVPAAAQGPAAAHHRAVQALVEQAGKLGGRDRRQMGERRHQLGEARGQRLALLLRPEARGAGFFVGRGQRLGAFDQGGEQRGGRHLAPAASALERGQRVG